MGISEEFFCPYNCSLDVYLSSCVSILSWACLISHYMYSVCIFFGNKVRIDIATYEQKSVAMSEVDAMIGRRKL